MSEGEPIPSVVQLMVNRHNEGSLSNDRNPQDNNRLSLNFQGGFLKTARAAGMAKALSDLDLWDTGDSIKPISGGNLAVSGTLGGDPDDAFQLLLGIRQYFHFPALLRLARGDANGDAFFRADAFTSDFLSKLDFNRANDPRISLRATDAQTGESLIQPHARTMTELAITTEASLHTPALAGKPRYGKLDGGLNKNVGGISPLDPNDTHAAYFFTQPEGPPRKNSFFDRRFGRRIMENSGLSEAGWLVYYFEDNAAAAREKILKAAKQSLTPHLRRGQTLVHAFQVPATEPGMSPFTTKPAAMEHAREVGYHTIIKDFEPHGIRPRRKINRVIFA